MFKTIGVGIRDSEKSYSRIRIHNALIVDIASAVWLQGEAIPAEQLTRGRVLKLTGTTRQHAGMYTCHADNGWGELANATVCATCTWQMSIG